MTFYYRPGILSPTKSCRRCREGLHSLCTHHPSGGGSSTRKETPRPPCECERADHIGEPGTCSVFFQGEWYNKRCGRPAKGTIEVKMADEVFTIEACGIHIAAWRRRVEGDRKREEEWARQRERMEVNRKASQASQDWAERLQAEFGLKAAPLRSEDGEILVGLAPEPLYEVLSEVRQVLDEVYGEDHHPLSRINNVDPDQSEGG